MDKITEGDIISLIQRGEERPDFDYKTDIDLTASKKDKVEISKDIIAMANSEGGILVGGIKETTNGYEYIGMPEKSLSAFNSTALNDFVKNYCDPPINTTTRKVTIDDKVYGVVIVPEFFDQIHIVTKDYPSILQVGDILIRSSSNNSIRATPNDLRNLINKAVQRRQSILKNFLQAALEANRPALIGGVPSDVESLEAPFDQSEISENYKGFRIIQLAPNNPSFIKLTEIKSAVEKSTITDLDSGYPIFPHHGLLKSLEKRLPTGLVLENESGVWRELSFTYLEKQGGVFYAESLMEDHEDVPKELGKIGLLSTIRTMLGAFLFGRMYYPAIGYEGNIEIQYSQESSIPRILYMDSQSYWRFHGHYSNDMAIPVTVSRSFQTDSNLGQIDELAIDMMTEFFWYFNYDLDPDSATHYLDYVKRKHIAIPQSLVPKTNETEG